MASYTMLRMEWKFQGAVFALFLLGYMIPMHATLLPLMKLLGKLGLLDSRLALIFPYIAFGLPFAIYILSGFMRAIPRELEEAACIDGCNIFQIFFRVIMPLLKPVISTIVIFTFLSAWNELMLAMTFINDASKKTLTYGIMSFEGQYAVDWGTVGAGLSIATIPVLIFYLIFAEAFQKGIIAGAVKG